MANALILGSLVACATALATPAAGQTSPPAPASGRTLVAAAKLPAIGETPLHFKAMSLALPQGSHSGLATADGILYSVSGRTLVLVGGDMKTLNPGQGVFIPGGSMALLKADDGEPSKCLHFLLGPAADLEKAGAGTPAAVKTEYRTAEPLPGLKPGKYDINLARITFPAQSPTNRPHYRTGAALYYVVSGTGANTIDGRTVEKPPGSFIYEPAGLVHQWGNPGSEPFTFLVFNINLEGVPAVAVETPPKAP